VRTKLSPPDFLLLGIAPPAPRGATAFAPRAKYLAFQSLDNIIRHMPRATEPLALYTYAFTVGITPPGQSYTPPLMFPLWPNPYAVNQPG
jgi:hypothetical protein